MYNFNGEQLAIQCAILVLFLMKVFVRISDP